MPIVISHFYFPIVMTPGGDRSPGGSVNLTSSQVPVSAVDIVPRSLQSQQIHIGASPAATIDAGDIETRFLPSSTAGLSSPVAPSIAPVFDTQPSPLFDNRYGNTDISPLISSVCGFLDADPSASMNF